MKKLFFIFIVVILFSIVYSDAFLFREDSEYEYMEFLSRQGIIDIELSNLPVVQKDLGAEIDSLSLKAVYEGFYINSVSAYLLKELKNGINTDKIIFNRLHGTYSTKDEFSANNDFCIKGAVGRLSFRTEFTTDYPYSDTLNATVWNKTASQMKNGYLGFDWDGGYVLVGRFLPAWGQGIFDNMFISRYVRHPDGILFDIHKGFLGFTYYASMLSEYPYPERIDHRKKYINMHKIYANLPFKTYAAFKEAIIFSSIQVEPYYLNPMLFYYITQWNSNNDDNIVWSVELKNRMLESVQISFEYFIDDFQYNPDAVDYTPNKTALLAVISYSPCFLENIVIESEYAMAEKYTGTHQYPNMTYTYYGDPLFYFTGSDSDLLGLIVKYRPIASTLLELSARRIRKGEGDVSVSWESQRPILQPAFPSGIVETTYQINASAQYTFLRNLKAGAEIGYESVSNMGNISGDSERIYNAKFYIEVSL